MSFYHENIIWQSQDGTWNAGFFDRIPSGSAFDEDYDPEWDDGYDYDNFQFVSTGHRSEDEAMRAWGGPNPGSFDIQHYDEASSEAIEQFEDIAARKYEEEGPTRVSPLYGKGSSDYHGPPKQRTLKAIKAELESSPRIHPWGGFKELLSGNAG